MVRGAILDIDGTLVLSNDAHARAWTQAFAEHGFDVPFERVRPLIGMGGDRLLAEIAPELNDQEGTGKSISERRKEIFLNRYLEMLKPAPGARALVAHMRQNGLRLVIASSAKPDELKALLEAARVADLLTEAIGLDEAQASKPAPDPVAAAVHKSGLPPDEVAMIGDTPYDIAAAHKARIQAIALRCGGAGDERLAGADAIFDDPEDLLAQYAESPLGGAPPHGADAPPAGVSPA